MKNADSYVNEHGYDLDCKVSYDYDCREKYNYDLFLEVMNDLAEEKMSNKTNLYTLYNGPYYRKWIGVNLDTIRFRASNKYELWLKIYNYFKVNGKPDRGMTIIYLMTHGCIMRMLLSDINEENEDITEYDAMVMAVNEVLTSWFRDEDLYWRKDNNEGDYVIV